MMEIEKHLDEMYDVLYELMSIIEPGRDYQEELMERMNHARQGILDDVEEAYLMGVDG
jgi:hypothetical protein